MGGRNHEMYGIANGFVMFHGLGQEDALIIEMIKLPGALAEHWKPYKNLMVDTCFLLLRSKR